MHTFEGPACSMFNARQAKKMPRGIYERDVLSVQCGAVLTRSISCQILTIDTPYLAREGEVWGVCCDSKVGFTFCRLYRSAAVNVVMNWTAL